MVRQNSVYLFINVFPLKDSETNHHEDDNLIQKQFDILFVWSRIFFIIDRNCFRTPMFMSVWRRLKVSLRFFVCINTPRSEWIDVFWELVPLSMSVSLLKYILTESIYDISSYAIRSTCIQGLSYLLDNPLSFREVKPFLPYACILICDKNEKVRIETVKLLSKVNDVCWFFMCRFQPSNHYLCSLWSQQKRCWIKSVKKNLIPNLFNSIQSYYYQSSGQEYVDAF